MVISMNRKINLWQLSGFAVTAIVGTLLHFLYEWLGEAWWIAPFSGVNESTWEHMKLLFWPMAIFALVQSLIFDGKRGLSPYPCCIIPITELSANPPTL